MYKGDVSGALAVDVEGEAVLCEVLAPPDNNNKHERCCAMGCGASARRQEPAEEPAPAPPVWQVVGCERSTVDAAFKQASAAGRRPAVIVLAGTFNPCHVGHRRALEDGRNYLETQTDYTVVAALMSPVSDARTSRKCEKLGTGRPMRLETRIAACEALSAELPWLGVLSLAAANLCAAVSR